MERPAIDNLHDPTKPEVYYFDEKTREAVLAKQAAHAGAAQEATEPAAKPVKRTAKKAAKKA